MPQEWSKEIVVRSILEQKRCDKKINGASVKKAYPILHRAGRRFYGSWGRALKAAGIDPATVDQRGRKQIWTERKVINTIRQFKKSGEPLNAHYMLHHHGGFYNSACKRFGSWAQAIAAAGFDYSTIRKNSPNWSKKQVLQEIKERWAQGLPLNEWEAGPRLASPARRLFGSWLKAIHAAGLSYQQIRKRDYRKRGWWTGNRVLMRIRQLEKRGVRLNPGNMLLVEHSLYWYAHYFFGGWYRAVEAAGFSYKKHYQKWSTKAFVWEMDEKTYRAKIGIEKT